MNAPDWLGSLKNWIYDVTDHSATEFWPSPVSGERPFFNYRLEQIKQVERDAMKIGTSESCDLEVILASVWIHDLFQGQFDGHDHARLASRWAQDNLARTGFPAYKVSAVAQCVALHHMHSLDIPAKMREARALWDADHVARIGPSSCLSYILCHTSNDFLEGLPQSTQYPHGSLTLEAFTPSLLRLRPQYYRSDWFYYDATRKMAHKRISAMHAFLNALQDQVQEDEPALHEPLQSMHLIS